MTSVVTEPSICIPRTLNNVTWFQVKNTFEELMGKGTVERVDIVSKSAHADSQPFCRIFVHFRYWPNSPDIMAIRDRLLAGETIKVVYDNPWFWKCAASRIPKPVKSAPKSAPYVEFMPKSGAETLTGDPAGEAAGEAVDAAAGEGAAVDAVGGELVGDGEGEAVLIDARYRTQPFQASPVPIRRSYTRGVHLAGPVGSIPADEIVEASSEA